MSNQMVRAQMEEVKDILQQSVTDTNDYLNQQSMGAMLLEEGSHHKEYYKLLLKALRRLEVFCDEAYDAVQVILKSESFRKPAAERTLYGIYHQCVMEFFSPKGDIWYEDSRAAYTGNNAIKYHHEPPQSFKKLIVKLEKSFQQMREDLAYYETDYHTKMVMNEDQRSSS
ncbi:MULTISPECIES: DUF3907 family protein [Pontibacillus]|uniref:DUF3907 family protein n=1 Tax=Pontibacillus chungwhensis TaxID=265426 RepID=A0ABY8URY5_9BACI|nr:MULTISPECIES: DUF3907 family protein [Pontibacillus]MCD5323048.1 YpuI family protein [Pontibacillus sp. HN14]WIF96441.1 DUF3907 family protein [Pontibacillus chungwhensis]